MDKKLYTEFVSLKIKDLFWNEYTARVRGTMLPYQLKALNDEIENAPKSYCLENFKKAGEAVRLRAQKKETPVYPTDRWEYKEGECPDGSFHGWCFQDSDAYKWIEAAAYALRDFPDTELEKKCDEVIELIADAQMQNGYLDTLYIINDPSKAFTNLKDRHELYCFGHLAEAAVAYYCSTGKGTLLNCALRFADLICDTFNEKGCLGYPGHEIAELALVKLYRITGCKKYLNAAEFFINRRGTKPYYFDLERGCKRTDDSIDYVYNQAHIPVREQREAVGHAVRGAYLYSGMADVARESGDNELYQACREIWSDIVNKKMYITGGIGSTVDGEAFTYAYDLPNDLAYCETCASIGLIFFAKRMMEIAPDSELADVTERVLYNIVLDGMSEDATEFFYVNPLEVLPEASRLDSRKRHIKPVRQKWFGCACCPPNLARLILSLGDYCVSEDRDNMFVHLYVGGEVKSEKADVVVSSDYMKSGRVQLDIKAHRDFTLALRIPSWCSSFNINKEYEMRDGYACVKICGDDSIVIDFDIKPTLVKCSNAVRANVGKAAVMRGGVVYCAEAADNGENLQCLLLSSDGELKVNDDMSITAQGFREQADESLYSKYSPPKLTPCEIRLVPYYSWGNRGENEMTVYLRIK